MPRSQPPPWKRVAAALGRVIPRTRLHPEVLRWAETATRRGAWGVALSGGADSVALLLLLWAHWPGRRRGLVALHFNHRLRGAESRGDAAFCRRLCRALGVRLITGAWRRPRKPGMAAARTMGRTRDADAADVSEAAARAARLRFLESHARVVWLGHQQDDVAESLLMRLARGSGSGGLGAPRPVQRTAGGGVRLRPLLAWKKAELAAALQAAGGRWREDSSNAGRGYFRNRVRHDVIPAWVQAAGRDAVAGAARARELLAEDDAALEAWTDAIGATDGRGRLRLRRLAGKPRAIWRRALHRWLAAQPGAGGLARQAFESLLAAAERGAPTRHSVGREGFAVVRGGWLRFEPGRRKAAEERVLPRRAN